jgi:ionotropic glutamate receptor
MNLNPDVFVNSTENGIQRVKNGGYAFLLESTMNEYRRQRDCDLMQVGGLIDSKGYGIGTPTGSPWRDQISSAILKLQEDSILQFLYTKWWKQKGAVACENTDEMKKDSANELGLANVGGVFVVLVAGLGLSVVAALLEFLWKARKNKDKRVRLSFL